MTLADAIRLGSEHSPQGFGAFQRVLRRKTGHVTATCALGAAYLGLMGRHRRKTDAPVLTTLEEAFPAMARDWPRTTLPPCQCPDMLPATIFVPEGVSVKRVVTHLNDFHEWSREEIAALLDTHGLG